MHVSLHVLVSVRAHVYAYVNECTEVRVCCVILYPVDADGTIVFLK